MAWRGRVRDAVFGMRGAVRARASGPGTSPGSTGPLGTRRSWRPLRALFRYVDGCFQVHSSCRAQIHDMFKATLSRRRVRRPRRRVGQRRIGEMLLELVADVRAALGSDTLCLGGGLFYNTFHHPDSQIWNFSRHLFSDQSRNAGLAVGAPDAGAADGHAATASVVSPFLGPSMSRKRSRPRWTAANFRIRSEPRPKPSTGR